MNKDKFVFGIIEGDYGAGKTLGLTALGTLTWDSYNKVYANYKLKNIPNFVFLPNIREGVLTSLEENSLILITELYKYIDKRFCMKKENIKITHDIQEVRKGRYDLMGDCFDLTMIDYRFRDIFNFCLRAEKSINEKELSSIFQYRLCRYDKIYDKVNYSDEVFYLDANDYKDNYDTYERVNKRKLLTAFC